MQLKKGTYCLQHRVHKLVIKREEYSVIEVLHDKKNE